MTDPLAYAQQIAYSTKETLMFTYSMAVKFKDTPGVYVECGVAAGAQIIAMAYGAPNKTIYAFDSFEGIALPSNRDNQYPGIKMLTESEQKALPDPGKQVLETSGATSVSLESFIEHLDNAIGVEMKYIHEYAARLDLSNKCIVMPMIGWFEVTVAPMSVLLDKIAILRLDGDLYNSTWVCLQHLFPKVIQGGCVIIDDWELPGCQSACKEYFELIGYEPYFLYISNIVYFYK